MQSYPDDDRQDGAHPIRVGDLTIDLDDLLIIFLDGTTTPLTLRERNLLRLLLLSHGRVLSYAVLSREAWQQPDDCYSLDSIRHCICRLRRKLGDAAAIESVRSVGYRFRRPTPGSSDTTSGRSQV